ncbi:MAG: methylenetetrahydrofolate reductase [NAD(P)H] [Thermodesulfovibrionales bacterium]
MLIRDILRERDKGVSFEFFPPKTEEGKDTFMAVVRELRAFNPLYVSVTYGAGGTTQDRTYRTLMWLRNETDLTVMSHLTCIGATERAMDELLKRYISIGVDNILALRGDPPKGVPDFDPLKGEFRYASDLVRFIKKYESFSIAVAVYPEGHQESPSLEKDLEYTKKKIDEGADFAITQMFFDNTYFYKFMERADKSGIRIPIIPGIMPIGDIRKIMEFASFCKATIPDSIIKRMESFQDNPEEMKKIGIEIAIKQCMELRSNGIRFFHFYTLNRADMVRSIVEAIEI